MQIFCRSNSCKKPTASAGVKNSERNYNNNGTNRTDNSREESDRLERRKITSTKKILEADNIK